MLEPYSYPKSINSQLNTIAPCNFCDICKDFLEAERKFTSKVTGQTYFIKRYLSCNSKNVIYLITCDKFKDRLGKDEPCFRVQKSDTKTRQERCGTFIHKYP